MSVFWYVLCLYFDSYYVCIFLTSKKMCPILHYSASFLISQNPVKTCTEFLFDKMFRKSTNPTAHVVTYICIVFVLSSDKNSRLV